ncbi:hypothetical protein G3T36_08030 [Diaminobutyricibacter tongyongensis]|uniref:Cell wall-binding repeat-containing protein n=1 Tax=Leifsonia tongyongensis TaxID=1268043 RepID=A0A6L9XWM1_9MICO|nr:hypothetical protein [Diaminobutyricibacter tongyongensis]NEN05819.1 hypothetical protein [Diaminobutyricibacter tongyongensis]
MKYVFNKGPKLEGRRGLLAGAGVGAVVALAIAGGISASAVPPTATTAPTSTKAPTSTTPSPKSSAASGSVDPNSKSLYPFGQPQGGVAVNTPPPPGEPTLSPAYATKTTTRIYGSNPFEEAVSVSQHIWTSALPENVPANAGNNADRTRAVTLVTPDDPLTDITATPLIHFPDAAPILYVTKNGIPAITLNELKRLGPVGISRFNNVHALLVGAAANPGVESQLKAIGMKYYEVKGADVPQLADNVDKLYGSISNPDFGVATMPGMEDVVVGSMDGKDWQYTLPATHWVAHMPTGLFWVHRNSIPTATIDALKRRGGKARIYLFGGPDQISASVAKQLYQYGEVIRVSNDDPVAFNAPAPDSPEATALAFAKMWDPAGMFGWKITGPGHGFTLVNINDWQGAIASAPLSHLGFHAPLLLTSSASTLPSDLESYFTQVSPSFLNTPADGPYNMTYVLGSWNQVNWDEQVRVDSISEMHNRRVVGSDTGGTYGDSQPGA